MDKTKVPTTEELKDIVRDLIVRLPTELKVLLIVYDNVKCNIAGNGSELEAIRICKDYISARETENSIQKG